MSDGKEAAGAAKVKGNAAFSAKHYAEAIEHFTEAIKHDPSDHVFFSNRSACYASLEKYDEALQDGAECVKLKPDWHKGYARKALAEFFLDKWDDSSETYQAGLKLAPDDQGLKEGLKKAMDAKYDVPGGRPTKRRRVSSDGGSGMNGMPEFNAGSLARAAAANPKIKEYMKDEALMKKVNTLMGILSMTAGRPDAVPEGMLNSLLGNDQRVLEIFMAAQGVQMDMSSAEFKEATSGAAASSSPSQPEKKSEADRPDEKVKTDTPAAPEDTRTAEQKELDELKTKGNAFYKKRKFDEAIGCYDEALAKNPNDLIFHNNKCAVLVEQGEANYEKVLETCRDLINRRYDINTSNPGGASFEKVAKVYNRMASVYEKQKKYDEAIEMYNKSLTEDNQRNTRNLLREAERAKEKYEKDQYLDPIKAGEHREKGNECFKNKDWVGAKKEYDEALQRNPTDAKLYSNRAAALTKLLAYPDALRDLDECIKLDPTFVKAYSRKGAAHFFMKEYHKALQAYEKGLEKDPSSEECKNGREQVIATISSTSRSSEVDEEQVRHSMADPEIQRILKDPRISMALKAMQEDPKKANDMIQKDPDIRSAVSKLIAAGIVRTR